MLFKQKRKPESGADSGGVDTENVFVARQPVFNPDKSVWGYELLYRASGKAATAQVLDEDMATANVIADGYSLAATGIPAGSKVLINFPRKLLVEDVAFALPSESCIVEILENVVPDEDVISAVQRLKRAGYTIAIDDYTGQPEMEPLVPYADIIKIDLMGVEDADHLKRVAAAVADGRRTLLAEKLEDLDTFHATRDLGFSLFQGFFFARPEIVPGRKFSSNQVAKLQLLQELGRPDFDVARLTDIIQTDPGLSYRLFRYINSVGFAVRTKVESVTRAITLLGELQIKQWLRVVLMSDLNPSPKTSELTFVSVHRARFLEMLAREAESVDRSPETMFTLGLFSLLDGLMDMPMGEILKNMPLDTVITQAMMERDHPLHLYLELCADYEHGRWLEAFTRLQEIGLDQEIADRLYMDSRLWTAKIMGLAVEDEEEASGDEPENDDPSPAE